jgi:hypothetical protein
MSRFMVLHYGFEMPTPEVMHAWGAWFTSLGPALVDGGSNFGLGAEITVTGSRDLDEDPSPITGYCIIEADSLDAALALVSGVPVIDAVRVYELNQPPPPAA